MRKLVVLRPEPGARKTLDAARQRGLKAIHVPLFKVQPVPWEVPQPGEFDGMLVTSANAIRCAGERLADLRGLKAYAVGEATAAAVRGAGFDVASTGTAGVERLLGSVESGLRLLHLCGEDRREPGAAKQAVTPVVVYRAATIAQPPRLEQLAQAVVLVHSPRAGQRIAELVAAKQDIAVAAISHAAAEACGEGWERMEACEAPEDDALLSLAERLCKDSPAL